ncbi:MAG: hypothetical protein ACXADB_03835 [Candidatus Hermodarchaeia archaeon]|jgi:hypothetical protein
MDIRVVEIVENEDGSANLILEISDEFKRWFKDTQGLKRFSQKRLEKFVIKALEAGLDGYDKDK